MKEDEELVDIHPLHIYRVISKGYSQVLLQCYVGMNSRAYKKSLLSQDLLYLPAFKTSHRHCYSLIKVSDAYADISLWSILLLIHNSSDTLYVVPCFWYFWYYFWYLLVLHNIAASIVYHIVQYCISYHIVLLILLYSPAYHTAYSATAIVHILLLSFYHIQYSISVLLSYTH